MIKCCQRGSALIEFVLSYSLLLVLTGGALGTFYYATCHFWIRHQLQEALVCAQEKNGLSLCRRTYETEIQSFLPIGELKDLSLKSRAQSISASADFKLYGKMHIRQSQSLDLSLEGFKPLYGNR